MANMAIKRRNNVKKGNDNPKYVSNLDPKYAPTKADTNICIAMPEYLR